MKITKRNPTIICRFLYGLKNYSRDFKGVDFLYFFNIVKFPLIIFFERGSKLVCSI